MHRHRAHHCHWPQGICTTNFAKIGPAVPGICSQTDTHRQTDSEKNWLQYSAPLPVWSYQSFLGLLKISQKFVDKFLSKSAYKQTDRQTDQSKLITSLLDSNQWMMWITANSLHTISTKLSQSRLSQMNFFYKTDMMKLNGRTTFWCEHIIDILMLYKTTISRMSDKKVTKWGSLPAQFWHRVIAMLTAAHSGPTDREYVILL